MFSYGFGVPSIVHFPLFEVAYELYCNKPTPLNLRTLKVFNHVIREKKSLKK